MQSDFVNVMFNLLTVRKHRWSWEVKNIFSNLFTTCLQYSPVNKKQSLQNSRNSLTIYISTFLWAHGQVVDPGSRCGSWCHIHHTGVVSPHHGASRSPHRQCSPNSANLSGESPWWPVHKTRISYAKDILQYNLRKLGGGAILTN